jgi:phosphohistidine phosphatase
MAFYIVQHGKNLPKDLDPEKGLSPQGITEVEKIAKVAQNYGVKVDQIQHSGLKRARQTADILAAVLKPERGVQEVANIKPLDDIMDFVSQVDYSANAMIVGHLPFLERLTSFLITGRQSPIIFKLQNGGILCLDRIENSDAPAIKWALMPHVK